MKILHVDTGREMRGGQHQVMLLMRGLQAAGHECVLLARRGSPLAKAAGQAGWPVFPAALQEMWKRSPAVEIVHAHDARAHTIAAVAARARFVVSRRAAFPLHQTWLSRFKYQRATRYLAVSHFVATRLYRAGVRPDRVDVVFDAVDDWGCRLVWNPQNPAIAPAFRNDPKKLSLLTAEACRLANVELRLSADLRQDLRQASVFIYLTESEGLGSAALLAMAAGVPVIASSVEGLAEVFEHDRSGLYVQNVAAEVATCIRRVLDEPGLAVRLCEAARIRVRDCFSVSTLVAETLRSYQRAIVQ